MLQGHLFVLMGDIFHLQCTARVVSAEGGVRLVPGRVWRRPGLPTRPDEPLSPDAYFGRWTKGINPPVGQPEPETWVVDVTDGRHSTPPKLCARICKLITTIIEEDRKERANDPRGSRPPLHIALPFLGTGGAGAYDVRDHLLRLYLSDLGRIAQQEGVAISLVFNNTNLGKSGYATAQMLRQREIAQTFANHGGLESLENVRENLMSGRLAIFVGAGVSLSAGLPGWAKLLRHLHRQIEKKSQAKVPSWEELHSLDPLLCAELLQSLWPVADPADRCQAMSLAIQELVRAPRYGLLHALIAGLPVQDYVTTNYDDLLEKAILDAGRSVQVIPSTSTSPRPGPRPCRLLKVHGSVAEDGAQAEPTGIVLTLRDYQRFQKGASALGGAVQGLMLSHHLLFVGYGMVDPNFIWLHESVARLLPTEQATQNSVGTALMVERENWKIELADRLLAGIHCRRPTEAAPGDDQVLTDARKLEIYLDYLGVISFSSLAAGRDQRLLSLLSEEDSSLILALRNLPMRDNASTLAERVRRLRRELGIE